MYVCMYVCMYVHMFVTNKLGYLIWSTPLMIHILNQHDPESAFVGYI